MNQPGPRLREIVFEVYENLPRQLAVSTVHGRRFVDVHGLSLPDNAPVDPLKTDQQRVAIEV